MPRRTALKTTGHVSSERVVQDRRSRFNPIQNLTPQTLLRRIVAWEAGWLQELAQTFHAVENRDDNLVTVAPARYEAPAQLPWDVLIVDGEQENPLAKRQRAQLIYFYNHLSATDVTEQNVRGGVSVLLRQAARAIGHKYAAHEIVWQPRDPVIEMVNDSPVVRAGLAAEFRFVPLWFFENTQSRLRYLPHLAQLDGEELPGGEWFVAVGRGLLLASTINYLFQRMALNDWAAFNRDFGRPLIDAATSAAKGSPEWNALKADLEDLFGAKALLHGTGATVGFSKAAEGQACFDGILERLEKRVLRMWGGGDLATQSGTSDSVGVTLQKTSQDRQLESDAGWLGEQCNEAIDKPVLRWWHGPDVEPLAYFKLITPSQENANTEIAKDTFLLSIGAQMKIGAIAERHGRTVENGDDLATAPAAPVATAAPRAPVATELTNEALTDEERLAAALVADLAPFRDKYGPVLQRLAAALAMSPEFQRAEIEALRPELAAMLADKTVVRAVLAGNIAGRTLEKILGREVANALAEGKS